MSQQSSSPTAPHHPRAKAHERHGAPLVPRPVPLKPRRRLFVVLSIVTLLWTIALAWLYFAAVRPHATASPTSSTQPH
jgi:hypothetical protein